MVASIVDRQNRVIGSRIVVVLNEPVTFQTTDGLVTAVEGQDAIAIHRHHHRIDDAVR